MIAWIAEADAFPTGERELRSAIEEASGDVRFLGFHELDSRLPTADAVVFRGSFQAATEFATNHKGAAPGVIGSDLDHRCSNIHRQLGDVMLNRDHRFVAFGELSDRWPILLEEFGSDRLFLRPDTGAKAFSGQVAADFEQFLRKESVYLRTMSSEALCLVAAPQELVGEWRFIVVDQKVVAGSRYRAGGVRSIAPEVRAKAEDFASRIVERLEMRDIAYALDIAEEPDGRLSVIETNAFSCADWYAADVRAIVRALHRAL